MTHEEASALVNNLTLEEKLKLKAFLDTWCNADKKRAAPVLRTPKRQRLEKLLRRAFLTSILEDT